MPDKGKFLNVFLVYFFVKVAGAMPPALKVGGAAAPSAPPVPTPMLAAYAVLNESRELLWLTMHQAGK